MCVWSPDWPLGERHPDEPTLIVGERGKVVAVSEGARLLGARPGMERREAEMLVPGGVVRMRDPGEEWRRFEPTVRLIEEVVPRVELVEPGLALVPLAGAIRYYGGEEPVVEILSSKLDGFCIGVADGPFAATWAARTAVPGGPVVVKDTRRFLDRLDISALIGETADAENLVATFRWLGVTTLGSLAGLPREALATRFGASGMALHRLAHGEDRMVDPAPIPPELAVELTFEDPLESLDQAGFAARQASARLMKTLTAQGVSPHRVTVEIESGRGEVRARVWRSLDPFTESALADRVWWQLRSWLEAGQISGGMVRLRLDPSDISGEGRQLALFEDVTARVEAERALARVQALLDHDAVVQAMPRAGRMPQQQVEWSRWGETSGSGSPDRHPPGATPAPAPSLVPPSPTPLVVEWDEGLPIRVRLGSRWEPVLTWSGPWRLTGKWWKGEQVVDRYQIVTSVGAFLCVVDGDKTYLAGVYD